MGYAAVLDTGDERDEGGNPGGVSDASREASAPLQHLPLIATPDTTARSAVPLASAPSPALDTSLAASDSVVLPLEWIPSDEDASSPSQAYPGWPLVLPSGSPPGRAAAAPGPGTHRGTRGKPASPIQMARRDPGAEAVLRTNTSVPPAAGPPGPPARPTFPTYPEEVAVARPVALVMGTPSPQPAAAPASAPSKAAVPQAPSTRAVAATPTSAPAGSPTGVSTVNPWLIDPSDAPAGAAAIPTSTARRDQRQYPAVATQTAQATATSAAIDTDDPARHMMLYPDVGDVIATISRVGAPTPAPALIGPQPLQTGQPQDPNQGPLHLPPIPGYQPNGGSTNPATQTAAAAPSQAGPGPLPAASAPAQVGPVLPGIAAPALQAQTGPQRPFDEDDLPPAAGPASFPTGLPQLAVPQLSQLEAALTPLAQVAGAIGQNVVRGAQQAASSAQPSPNTAINTAINASPATQAQQASIDVPVPSAAAVSSPTPSQTPSPPPSPSPSASPPPSSFPPPSPSPSLSPSPQAAPLTPPVSKAVAPPSPSAPRAALPPASPAAGSESPTPPAVATGYPGLSKTSPSAVIAIVPADPQPPASPVPSPPPAPPLSPPVGNDKVATDENGFVVTNGGSSEGRRGDVDTGEADGSTGSSQPRFPASDNG